MSTESDGGSDCHPNNLSIDRGSYLRWSSRIFLVNHVVPTSRNNNTTGSTSPCLGNGREPAMDRGSSRLVCTLQSQIRSDRLELEDPPSEPRPPDLPEQ